jgi:hypothetical protein
VVAGGTAANGVSYNGIFGAALLYNAINPNATVYSFNDNLSSTANLVGWWPLTFGEQGNGNTIYDLSGNGDNGIGMNTITGGTAAPIQWSPLTLSRRFSAALFAGSTGASSKYGAITINATGTLNSIVSANNFTFVSWIKYNGGSAAGCYGIFGSGGISGTGIQLDAKSSGTQCGIAYVGTGNMVGNYPVPLNNLNWTMVSMAWSGVSSKVSVFENGSAIYSNTVSGSTGLTPSGGLYYIGAQSSSGTGTFNGLISNAQIYSKTLNAQQIGQLYSEGPTGIPLSGAGLSGWWPLTDNAFSYSGAPNGTATYNAAFANANYTFAQSTAPTARVATFNGLYAVKISGSGIEFSKPFTTSFWFNTFNSPGQSFDYELLDGQLPGNNGYYYDVQLCGGGASGPCGFSGINGKIGTGSASLSSTVNAIFQFVPDRPYHVAEIFSATGWSVFLNGVNVSHGTYSGTPAFSATSTGYLTVGGGNTASGYFYGQIYGLQVYNSVLTATQIRQIYQQGPAPQSSVTLSMG